jgi:hypothetical protein
MNQRAEKWIDPDGVIPSCVLVKLVAKSLEKKARRDFNAIGFDGLADRVKVSVVKFVKLGIFGEEE